MLYLVTVGWLVCDKYFGVSFGKKKDIDRLQQHWEEGCLPVIVSMEQRLEKTMVGKIQFLLHMNLEKCSKIC
jgi:hypothetical protein